MADMLTSGAIWQNRQLVASASHEVLYTRKGGTSITILATVGQSQHQTIEKGTGSVIRTKSKDYIVEATVLDFGAGAVLPQPGDVITDNIEGVDHEYLVSPFGIDPCYRFSDPHGIRLRIHTKARNQN